MTAWMVDFGGMIVVCTGALALAMLPIDMIRHWVWGRSA